MKRLLTIAALMIAIVTGACGDSNSPASLASPTRTRPEAPSPAPTAKLEGTMTVATSHTANGGVRYTAQIRLTQSDGVAATVTAIELAPADAWGPYPAFATFGPEAWSDSNVIDANGTLTSKPLVFAEELPQDYLYQIEARVTFGESVAVSRRTYSISAIVPPIPQPPPGTKLTLTGVVSGTDTDALSDVTVEVLNGENAGRKARTGQDGRYTLAGLKPGEFTVQCSRAGYLAQATALDLRSNRTLPYYLTPKM